MMNNKFHAAAGTKGSHTRLLPLLFLSALLVLGTVPGFAAGNSGKVRDAIGQLHGQNLAVDLSDFPVNPDGTVDVIIQFNQKFEARHLAMMNAQGGKLKVKLEQINSGAFRIPVRVLRFLENHPEVAYVTPDRPNAPAFDAVTAAAVTADIARQHYGMDGTGVGIAIIDSGVYNHDDLQKSSGTGSRIVYSESFVSGDTRTADLYGHGTHVAGIIAGNGKDSVSGYPMQYTGIAANANIINLRVLDANGAGTDSQVIAAIQRAIALKNTYNIRVMNLSLGRKVFESYTLDPLCQAVEAAWKAGIVVVVSAGNAGRDNTYSTNGYATIQAPGNDPAVITVGATKTQDTMLRTDDVIASYSSKGPSLIDHVVKPDLVAPGNRIVSLLAPNATLPMLNPTLDLVPTVPLNVCTVNLLGATLCTQDSSSKYMRLSGTSMATPIVAAGAALMIQKDPTLTPDIIKARMMKTAWKNYPVNSWAYDRLGNSYLSQYDVFTIGAGYLDINAALSNTDGMAGGAPSPSAVYDSNSHKIRLVRGTPLVGTTVVWGSSVIWGESVVWGGNTIISDSVIWGDSVVWGDSTCSGFSVIWGDSVAGGGSILALSSSEDGEN